LNFILAFYFVFTTMVPTINFHCNFCFQKQISFCELWGIFCFLKKFEGLQFSSSFHFGGLHFIFLV
jgi:hypothetical protein